MNEQMVPNMDNGGRWDHIASEQELMRALRFQKDPVVYEIPMICMTYMICRDYLTTIRCGGTMGGDTRDVEGGWVYAHDLAQRLDENEVARLANNPINFTL